MNKILFRAEEISLPLWIKEAKSFIQAVLKTLGYNNWELSVLFCNNRFIKTLNAQYRNKDEPTDILSFPIGETSPDGNFLAGDIVISLDALEENSRFFKIPENEELRRLLVHGILHLSGNDHDTNGTNEPMLKAQEKILAEYRSIHYEP
jgi:probable rRNA maturation factor